MKIIKHLLLLILFASLYNCATGRVDYYIKTVPSQKNYIAKVAMIQENWDNYWVSSISYRSLITELMDVGFKVIEMENLDKILDEQKRQYSGLVDDSKDELESNDTGFLNKTTIAQIGKMLDVEYLIPVYVMPSNRKVNMATVRLVSVETGEVITSTTIVTPLLGKDVDIVMKQVALDMGESFIEKKKVLRKQLFGTNNVTQSNGDDAIEEFNESRQ
jgi:hypothetical protein